MPPDEEDDDEEDEDDEEDDEEEDSDTESSDGAAAEAASEAATDGTDGEEKNMPPIWDTRLPTLDTLASIACSGGHTTTRRFLRAPHPSGVTGGAMSPEGPTEEDAWATEGGGGVLRHEEEERLDMIQLDKNKYT